VTSTPFLEDALVAAGLPKSPPTGGATDSRIPWTVVIVIGAMGALIAVAAFAAVRARRRPETVPIP
jgi:hypothetical protein